MKNMKLFSNLWSILSLFVSAYSIPVELLYDFEDPTASQLPKGTDLSSGEVRLKVPIVFYGEKFESIYVNTNGLLSFQTDIPIFFNIEFPLDYPCIAPFYSHVDTTLSGTITYYETDEPEALERATEAVHDAFITEDDFQAISVFIATWYKVGYYQKKANKTNTFQAIISTDGQKSFVEFLYPKSGLQWIRGTGDESGLPDARAQAGFVSVDGDHYTLPGSGKEQVSYLEKWSNVNDDGQWIFKIYGTTIREPDQNTDAHSLKLPPATCPEHQELYCHIQSTCTNYEQGFCCSCKKDFYGNGKSCIKKDIPIRANGKVSGKLNSEKFEHLDLQSYILMVDARAYTAITGIPESIGADFQSLQVLGGVLGFLFAKPIKTAQNGYQITGGVFNHTATIKFLTSNHSVFIKQKYLGLDVFDQLKFEAEIVGDIPEINSNTTNVENYQEEYRLTSPGVLQMSSKRMFTFTTPEGQAVLHEYSLEQTFTFDYCKFNQEILPGTIWKLKVGKNFISYDDTQQIVRFGLSNKIVPFGDFDPCEEGRSQCPPSSACVVENDSYRCVCNPGFQNFYSGNETFCTDLDECQMNLHGCDFNAQCINEIGGYACECNPGFEGDGHVCENAYSCQTVRCNENAQCEEYNGVAVCRCIPGFTGDGQLCTPIKSRSCNLANNCSPFGMCSIDRYTNEYYCSCLPSYAGDGYDCVKIPETTTSEPMNAQCEEYNGVVTCKCLPGFTGDGQLCTPVKSKTCEELNCSPYATCAINPDNNEYYCICLAGYTGNGYDCEKLSDDVTTTVTPEEEIKQDCLFGVCWCPTGYRVDSESDYCIKEAVTTTTESIKTTVIPSDVSCDVTNNCHQNAQCLYSSETDNYSCVCNSGFEGDGIRCDYVSCTHVFNCDLHASCVYNDTVGKSSCSCNHGYVGDGHTCIPAICSSDSDCTSTEECMYSQAERYECVCRDGYARDSQNNCVRLTGNCGGGTCVENAECLYDSDLQTMHCSCKSGFMGIGIVECKPIIIGCNELNNCGDHASCEYDELTLSYQCKCSEGYYGDGFNCYLQKSCHIDPSICDYHATCTPDANRNYMCRCNIGYTGNGTVCKEIRRHEGNFLLLNQGMATLRIPFSPTPSNPGRLVQVKRFQTAVSIDIDCVEGKVYWGDVSGGAIRFATYNGSERGDFITQGIGSPEGLAVDWVSRNIYWTDSAHDTVEVANIDNKRRRVLVNTDLVNPRGIAVHPQMGKIFWTDWNRKSPKIEWANADGTGRELFIRVDPTALPNSLTIDYDTEQICYTDAGTKKIECVNIDTRERQTIASDCDYPFGIAITDQHIYWSDWVKKRVEKIDKYSLVRQTPLKVPLGGSGNKLFGLVAVPEACEPLTNVCQYYKDQCPDEHICVPDGAGSRKCLCAFNADDPLEKPSCTL